MLAPENRHTLALAALVLAAFSYGLQQTMVLPALAHLQRDLHTTTTWSTWIFTGFLLSSAVLTPLIGKLGDQHGKGRLLTISLAIFLVGCIGAAAAWSIWSLIAFRVVQGAGGAVFPLSFAIIKDEFPRERSGAAIGAISAVFGAAGRVGSAALGADRRPPLVALAVRGRGGCGCGGNRRCGRPRSGVADQDTDPPRCAGGCASRSRSGWASPRPGSYCSPSGTIGPGRWCWE